MAPPSQGEKIDRLLEAVAGLKATVEDTRDAARETREDVGELGRQAAATDARLKAVEMAQESTAASVVNSHRMAVEAAAEFRQEIVRRVEAVERAALAIGPALSAEMAPVVADATNRAAQPTRRRIFNRANIAAGTGSLVLVIAVAKFFIPDSHAALGLWHVLVRAIDGTNKIIDGPA